MSVDIGDTIDMDEKEARELEAFDNRPQLPDPEIEQLRAALTKEQDAAIYWSEKYLSLASSIKLGGEASLADILKENEKLKRAAGLCADVVIGCGHVKTFHIDEYYEIFPEQRPSLVKPTEDQ